MFILRLQSGQAADWRGQAFSGQFGGQGMMGPQPMMVRFIQIVYLFLFSINMCFQKY